MKKRIKIGFFALIAILILSSFSSAEIMFTEQVQPVYNLGDSIYVPVTIKTLNGMYGVFEMNLICNGTLINFYKNGVKLTAGEEKRMDSSLVLIESVLGKNEGNCKVKASLGVDYILTEEFRISRLLTIDGEVEDDEFNAGEKVAVSGEVLRETGDSSNGFVEGVLYAEPTGTSENTTISEFSNITQYNTINNGFFEIDFLLPSNMKAGRYFIKITAYEKDTDGFTTNSGEAEYNFSVRQVPTILETQMELGEVNPGETAKVMAVLKDQTGIPIDAKVFITIKTSEDKILEQKEMKTGEYLEYPISSSEPPAEWKIFATSKKLTAEGKFTIKEKESIKVEIMNKTILIENDGNVKYNKTLLIKVEETPLNIQVDLDVGESKRYILSAPNGEYNVKVLTGDGSEISDLMSLTGNAIGIKEASFGSFTLLAWGLIITVLAFGVFILAKRLRKKPFFERLKDIRFKKNSDRNLPVMNENSLSRSINKAELCMTIKGNKQTASTAVLKIKNLKEMNSKKGGASELIEKIREIAEDKKAVIYENNDYLFFMFAPEKTKTMQNEKSALEIAETAKKMIIEHNRLFSQKVQFGISLVKGDVIAKVEDSVFKFMGMGNWITLAKKMASASNEEVLLSQEINDLLRTLIRSDKQNRDGLNVYVLTDVKKENEEARKFIDKFMNRQSKENKEE